MKRLLFLLLCSALLLWSQSFSTLAQSGGKAPAAARSQTSLQTQPGASSAETKKESGPSFLSALENTAGNADGSVASRIVQMTAVLTLLSFAPALLIMLTSFTRFAIALSLLRSGLGLQGAPSNLVLIALALFMTLYVMAPTFDKSWENGAKPLIEKRITEQDALPRILDPFKDFMQANVREKDLSLFEQMAEAKGLSKGNAETSPLRVLVPAFMISELRRSFEIGFLILLPFLVIDLIVATIVMSMGMMMLSPTVFSLPCKILFFVLIDGWSLLIHGLIRSFV